MTVFTFLVMLGMLATVVVLFRGIGSMVQGGEYDFEHSHHYMFARVALQLVTVALVLLALLLQVR